MARRAVAPALLVALLAASNDTPANGELYETNATVIQVGDEQPELCLGGVAASNPPQCGGPPIEGWDWDEVDGEESGEGISGSDAEGEHVVFGDYHVTGRYDGEAFTVVDAGPPRDDPEDDPEGDPFATPCPEPPGGWRVVDRDLPHDDVAPFGNAASRKQPDFAGEWVDYGDRGVVILNVAFTGSLARHERELREVWGGALCVSRRDHSYRELERVRRTLPGELGFETLWSSTDESEGKVAFGVILLDESTRSTIEERYGELLEVEERLQPVK